MGEGRPSDSAGPSPKLHPPQRPGLKLGRRLGGSSPLGQVASLEGSLGRSNLRDQVSNSDGN